MNTEKLKSIIIKNQYGCFSISDLIIEFQTQLYQKIDKKIINDFTLFGSYARGNFTEDSDVDLCIIYNETVISELEINIIVDRISDSLLDKYGVIIHALCFKNSYYQEHKNSSALFQTIQKEGIQGQL